jgi:phospholipid transport system substrate-binding protein
VKRFIGLTILLLWTAAATAVDDTASALVRNTSNQMLAALERNRTEIDRNPERIFSLVDTIVVPHFDFERITQSAVGRYWRQATPSQRAALTDQFQRLLVRTYAKALLSYSGQEIRYLPVRPGRGSGSVTVSTEVREAGGAPVSIDYRLNLKKGAWKVYDVSIDNVSLVSNYRSSFASQIRQNGIDGLIARLRQMNGKGQG